MGLVRVVDRVPRPVTDQQRVLRTVKKLIVGVQKLTVRARSPLQEPRVGGEKGPLDLSQNSGGYQKPLKNSQFASEVLRDSLVRLENRASRPVAEQ